MEQTPRRSSLQPRSFGAMVIAGAALFLGIFLIGRHFTPLSAFTILGSEFSAMFIWRLVRAFMPPISAYPALRNAKVLMAVPLGIYSAALFLAGSARLSRYALWLLIGGFLLHVGLVRPYITRLRHETTTSPRKGPNGSDS